MTTTTSGMQLPPGGRPRLAAGGWRVDPAQSDASFTATVVGRPVRRQAVPHLVAEHTAAEREAFLQIVRDHAQYFLLALLGFIQGICHIVENLIEMGHFI